LNIPFLLLSMLMVPISAQLKTDKQRAIHVTFSLLMKLPCFTFQSQTMVDSTSILARDLKCSHLYFSYPIISGSQFRWLCPKQTVMESLWLTL
jgi:hypothetical protein